MKVDDRVLREVLQEKIGLLNDKYPNTARKAVCDWMAEKYNVKYGDSENIFKTALPIESLSYDMLYKLMRSIHDALLEDVLERWKDLDLSDLRRDIYFTDIEIEEFEKPLPSDTKDEDIVFNEGDWFKVRYDQYSAKVTIDEVIKWRNNNKLIYNPETQRDLIIKQSKGGVLIKTVDINMDAVENMISLMKNDAFISDELTININTDINTSSNQLLTVKNGKLIIPKEAKIDLIDGFHRYVALCTMKDLYPEFEFNVKFNVVMFDTEKANKFMLQADKKNHLSDKQVVRINKSDEVNFIIDRLNGSSKFHLKGTISKDLYYDLNLLISEIFNPKKREESVNLYKLIEKNINELVEEYDFYDKQFTKEEWFIYLYCIKEAYDRCLNFLDLVSKLDVESLSKEISYKKRPLKKHYTILSKEVGK